MSVHKYDGGALNYWLERGRTVAARLNDHGVPAACELLETMSPDGHKMLALTFTVGSFAAILNAEQAADALDAIRAEAIEQLSKGGT